MRHIGVFSLILITGFYISSCYPDERDQIIKDGLNTLTFPCNDSTSEYYFIGKFNEDSICLYDNQFDCYAEFNQWSHWVTTSPFTTIGDSLDGEATTWLEIGINQWVPRNDNVPGGFANKDRYVIRTPQLAVDAFTTKDSIVKYFLQPGGSVFWQHDHNELGVRNGLEVFILRNHYNSDIKKDHTQLNLTSSRGEQLGSYIEITELSLHEIENHVEGYIHIRFKCKMYLDIHGKYEGHYDGDFVGNLTGEVRIPISYDR